MSTLPELRVEAITAEAFAPFGTLVHAGSARQVSAMNGGTATRWFDLLPLDVAAHDGRVQLSRCSAEGRALPLRIEMLERHPLGSQAFIPCQPHPYLVVVARDPGAPLHAFRVDGGIGVHYHRGCWHHPLLALQRTEFWILDRAGPGGNVDEALLAQPQQILAAQAAVHPL